VWLGYGPVQRARTVSMVRELGGEVSFYDLDVLFPGDVDSASRKASIVLRNLSLGWIDERYVCDVERVSLAGTEASDQQIARLAWLPKTGHLQLELDGTQLTDAGLNELRGLPLWYLSLNDTKITNAGLVLLPNKAMLSTLRLSDTAVDDHGLPHLQSLPRLWRLDLDGTRVSDAGMKHLKPLVGVQILSLRRTPITDEGVQQISSIQLMDLFLDETAVTDAGLLHLQSVRRLRHLSLCKTGVTDAGLLHLRGLPRLKTVDASGTAVTAEGAAALLPIRVIRKQP
jgi:hypothetical protein